MSTLVTSSEYLGDTKPVNAMEPVLSVRLLVYNQARFIRKCIDSVLMQNTDFPFEIVIGEDDSTDGTRTICQAYANQYPDRIRLILRSKKDKIILNGVTTSRYNFVETMIACRGKFIAMMDGDDYWTDPDKLQKEVEFLSKNPSYILTFHNAFHVNSNETVIRQSILSSSQKRDVSGTELQQAWGPPVTSTLCFRNVLEQFPSEFYEVINGDMFLVSLLGNYGAGKYLNEIRASAYRLHPGGMFSALTARKSVEFLQITWTKMAAYYARIDEPVLAKNFESKAKELASVLTNPLKALSFAIRRSLYRLQLHLTHDRVRAFFKGK